MTVRLLNCDVLEGLRQLADESVHCIVTSPPYWGLRVYGTEPQVWGGDPGCGHRWRTVVKPAANGIVNGGMQGETLSGNSATRAPVASGICERCGAWLGELGQEPDPWLFVEHLVEVFRECRRVLRADGTCWVNIGDTYAGSWGAQGDPSNLSLPRSGIYPARSPSRKPTGVLKRKDLVGIPWRVAFALQAGGWYLRQDIVWSKPNPMPESIRDRCTKAHEYIFLLPKSERYQYDDEAIAEPVAPSTIVRLSQPNIGSQAGSDRVPGKTNGNMKAVPPRFGGDHHRTESGNDYETGEGGKRNKRSVWSIATQPYPDAHFATFPEELPRLCILAGCPPGGTVLDPFAGSGTTLAVALKLGRDAVGIELNTDYCRLIERRLATVTPALRFEEVLV